MTLTYADFGRRVLAAAIPPDRIAGVVRHVIGDTIEIGPVDVGPADIGTVKAFGVPRHVDLAHCPDDGWDQSLTAVVDLDVNVDLPGGSARYEVSVVVKTRLRVSLEDPCMVVMDIEPVEAASVEATIDPDGAASRLIGWIGSVDTAVTTHVLEWINALIDSEQVNTACRVDVEKVLERAWNSGLVVELEEPAN